MYIPSSFRQEDPEKIHAMMRQLGFASLVTNTANGLMATHAPVLLDLGEGEHGVLRGHIAKANTQWRAALPEHEALAIFTGPNAYVSPQWYASKREHGRVVPTWNYAAVHAYGPVRFSEDRDLLLRIVTRLTEEHEAKLEHPWKVSDAPAEYVDGMLGAIVAFEMRIARLEASWKLSQNRTEADRAGVMQELKDRGEAVAKEMEKLYAPPTHAHREDE